MQNKIGEKICELRKAKGLKQRELAELLGVNQRVVSNIECGKNILSEMSTVDKILNLFDISFDYLFEDSLNVFKKINKTEFDKQVEFELFQMDSKDLHMVNNIILEFIEYEKSKENI